MIIKNNNYIVFDRVAYRELPVTISSNNETFGVQRDVRIALDNTTVPILRESENDSIIESNARNNKYNLIELRWGDDCLATVCLVDHLKTLYSTNKPFMFTLDQEFSREDEVLDKVSETEYKLPTYPVAHLKTVNAFNSQYDYAIDVNINGVSISNSNGYYVNNSTGSIIFFNPVLASDIVTVSYKWCIWCKINNFVYNNQDSIARNTYAVTLLLEQLEFPDNILAKDYLFTVNDCRECPSTKATETTIPKDEVDGDDTTTTVVCAIPTIFNNNGTNIVSGSSNQWGNYTGVSPFSTTISNHKVLDTVNTVGTKYPIHFINESLTRFTKSDILKLTGVTFTDIPANKNISKITVELDLQTEDATDTTVNIVDKLAKLYISGSLVKDLAYKRGINGSKTLTYTYAPESKIKTDSIVTNGIDFEFQVENDITAQNLGTKGYETSDWNVVLSSSTKTLSGLTEDEDSITVTGTYIGNVADIPTNLDYSVAMTIDQSFDAGVGAYTRSTGTIDSGLDNPKSWNLLNYSGTTFTYIQQKVFNVDVENGTFEIVIPMSVSCNTLTNGSPTAFSTVFTVTTHGIVRPNTVDFDPVKLFVINPITSGTQWTTVTDTYRGFAKWIYVRSSFGSPEGVLRATTGFTGGTGRPADVGWTYTHRGREFQGDVEYVSTYTGTGTPPPYVYITINSYLGYQYTANANESPLLNFYGVIDDKLSSSSVRSSVINTFSLVGTIYEYKTNTKIFKVPVVNGIARLIISDVKLVVPIIQGTDPINGTTSCATNKPPSVTDTDVTSTFFDGAITAFTERTIKIDQARVNVCWVEESNLSDKGVVNNIKTYELTPSSSTTTSQVASTAVIEKTFTYANSLFTDIPDDTKTIGVEVSKFTTDYDSPVNGTLNLAVAKAKLSYVASSTGFVEQIKSNQNVDWSEHYNQGVIDTTNDRTFGGLYDYFGKTRADLDKANIIANNGLVVYAKYNQTTPVATAFTSGDYTYVTSVTGTGGFSSGYTFVSGNANGYGGTPGGTLTWTGSSTSGKGELQTATLIEVTNTNGATPPPKYIYLTVTSTCYYSFTCTSHKTVVYDGFGYSTFTTTNPNTSVNSVKVKVPMGDNKKGYYLLNQKVAFDLVGATSVTANTGLTTAIATQQEVADISDVKIKLHTVLPSSTDAAVFRQSTWVTTPLKGTLGNIFRSSDGTLTGAYTLNLSSPYTLDLPTGSTDIVTGVEITFDAVSANAQSITDTLSVNYLYSNANTPATPQSYVLTGLGTTPVKVKIGGNNNLLGGTPTIANILEKLQLEISGTNAATKILQLSNIRVRIYYVKLQ
jgi:hypothetical protein